MVSQVAMNITIMLFTCTTVTVYLKRCLTFKRCRASGLSCRYVIPHMKLKFIELAIKLYQEF